MRIATSTGTKKAGIQVKDVSIWNISRIRHGCHQRAELQCLKLMFASLDLSIVDNTIVPFILVLISRYIQTLATNLAASLMVNYVANRLFLISNSLCAMSLKTASMQLPGTPYWIPGVRRGPKHDGHAFYIDHSRLFHSISNFVYLIKRFFDTTFRQSTYSIVVMYQDASDMVYYYSCNIQTGIQMTGSQTFSINLLHPVIISVPTTYKILDT